MYEHLSRLVRNKQKLSRRLCMFLCAGYKKKSTRKTTVEAMGVLVGKT